MESTSSKLIQSFLDSCQKLDFPNSEITEQFSDMNDLKLNVTDNSRAIKAKEVDYSGKGPLPSSFIPESCDIKTQQNSDSKVALDTQSKRFYSDNNLENSSKSNSTTIIQV